MKNTITVLMVVGALCAQAQEFTGRLKFNRNRVEPVIGSETVGEYTWTYRINGDAVVIVNRGSIAISPKPKGAITVPSTLGGKPVTSIGDRAFAGCSWIKQVTIPDGVTSIDGYAFSGCSALTSIVMPNVTNIGERAFYNCSGLASVTMPKVISIGSESFRGCIGLTSVVMQNVTSVGGNAFSGCHKLTSMTMPNVMSIGHDAFYGCSELVSVVMPNVKRIMNDAFSGCSGLTSVEVPNVECIEYDAFLGCCGLMNVALPASATNIAAEAFGSCSGLVSFSVDEANPKYKSVLGLLLTKDGKALVCGVNGEVVIPDSVTEVWDYAFAGFKCLTNVIVGTSAAYFGKGVFMGCNRLKKVAFKGNAPEAVPNDFYSGTPRDMVTYVEKDSVGWRGENSKELPEKWCDRPILYVGQEYIGPEEKQERRREAEREEQRRQLRAIQEELRRVREAKAVAGNDVVRTDNSEEMANPVRNSYPNDHTDDPIVLDMNGESWTWDAGCTNGLMFDCYCRIAPQTSGSAWSVLQRVRLTFATNGVLTHAELLPDRVRIQSRCK